jgi:hypothetical protein
MNCKGSIRLGTACLQCEKCKQELAGILNRLHKYEAENRDKKEERHWPGRYKAEELYYVPDIAHGHVNKRENARKELVKSDRECGIACKIRDEALFIQQQQSAYLELIDKIQELNEGWRPDWNDDNYKHEPCYNHYDGLISIVSDNSDQSLPDWFQAKSKQIWKTAIDQLGEPKIKLALWGIE